MMTIPRYVLAVAILTAASIPTTAAERPKVDVECKPAGEKLVYDCMFKVMGRKSGEPVADAEFKVGADMPTMPMAHNVKPIAPMAMGKPGMYHGKLHLEMMGEWALKLEFKKPVRDIVIKKLMFGDMAMQEHKHMDHSSHGKKKDGHGDHSSHGN